MQSLAAHTRTTQSSNTAVTLIRSILADTNPHLVGQRFSSQGLLNKLRQLISESVLNGRFTFRWRPPYALTNVNISSTASQTAPGVSHLNSVLKFLLPYQSLFWCFPNSPFIVIDRLAVQAAVKALHLITAYSGYSKEYLNSNYNTNIRSTRISVPVSTSAGLLNQRFKALGNNHKGCIGDDAWFIAKQSHADFLG